MRDRSRHGARARPSLDAQAIVVIGFSSGIGRAAALRLAARGARIVAVARNAAPVDALVAEIRSRGGEAESCVADVSAAGDLQRAADIAVASYGRIDTWVHAAGVLVVGAHDASPVDEVRRMLDVDFLGQVRGLRAALPELERAGGGAFISITSVEASVAFPYHAAYTAAKSATERYLDAVRRELLAGGSRVTITTIRPAAIDTPIYRVARNHFTRRARAARPFYDPSVVARAVEHAATHRVRRLDAGGAGVLMSALQAVAPRAVDLVLGGLAGRIMLSRQRLPQDLGNLDAPRSDGRVRGALPRPGRRWSAGTWLATHPRVRAVALAVGGLGTAVLIAMAASRRQR